MVSRATQTPALIPRPRGARTRALAKSSVMRAWHATNDARLAMYFQDVILALQDFWVEARLPHRAALQLRGRRRHVQPGHVPARDRPRALERRVRRALAPPDRRPLRRQPESHAAVSPVPGHPQALAARHPGPVPRVAAALGTKPEDHDVRFVEDDWESPTLGAWGLGWQVWLDGLEISQFTYFQQVGGIDCKPVSGELTYGLERICMYLQNVESFWDMQWAPGVPYAELVRRGEWEWSTYNFEQADTPRISPRSTRPSGSASACWRSGRRTR